MILMQLGGLGFDPKNMSPIILLKDSEERNFLPIWIGMFEAAAIAMELQDFKPPRPMTHDLITKTIKLLEATVQRIAISEIVENTFYAVIEVESKQKQLIKIDARPSLTEDLSKPKVNLEGINLEIIADLIKPCISITKS